MIIDQVNWLDFNKLQIYSFIVRGFRLGYAYIFEWIHDYVPMKLVSGLLVRIDNVLSIHAIYIDCICTRSNFWLDFISVKWMAFI